MRSGSPAGQGAEEEDRDIDVPVIGADEAVGAPLKGQVLLADTIHDGGLRLLGDAPDCSCHRSASSFSVNLRRTASTRESGRWPGGYGARHPVPAVLVEASLVGPAAGRDAAFGPNSAR